MVGTDYSTLLLGTTYVSLTDSSNLAILANCTGTPDTTAGLYQHGCLMMQTDSGTGSNAIYQNTGSSAVPAWSLLDTGTGFTLPTTATDSTTTTGISFALVQNAITTGTGMSQTINGLTTGVASLISHTTSVIASGGSLLRLSSTGIDTGTTTGVLLDLSSTASLAGTQILGTFSGLTTGIGMSIVTNALTTGQAVSITSTSTGVTSGSLLSISTATTGVLTTGIVAITATGNYTVSSSGLLAVTANSTNGGTLVRVVANALTTGTAVSISSSASSLTTGRMLFVQSSTAGAIATNGIVEISPSGAYTSTANVGAFNILAPTTTAGTIQSIFGNALTTGQAMFVSGTGVYTGTGFHQIVQSGATTGVVSLVQADGLTTGTAVSIASASADTSTRSLLLVSNTAAAAIGAAPLKTSNVALTGTGTKFTRHMVLTDGSKTSTIWLSTDATTPNGNLSGTVGDLCINGPSGRSFYCTGTTNWTASNA